MALYKLPNHSQLLESLKPFGSYRSIKKAQMQSIEECTQLAEAESKTDTGFLLGFP